MGGVQVRRSLSWGGGTGQVVSEWGVQTTDQEVSEWGGGCTGQEVSKWPVGGGYRSGGL